MTHEKCVCVEKMLVRLLKGKLQQECKNLGQRELVKQIGLVKNKLHAQTTRSSTQFTKVLNSTKLIILYNTTDTVISHISSH